MLDDPTTLAWMRDTQDGRMYDICHRLIYGEDQDEFNQPIAIYEEELEDIPCGLDMRPGNENSDDRMDILTWDATIRLPVHTVMNSKDRIRVISRGGEEVNFVFEIKGPPQRGPSALRLKLGKVEPNAEEISSST